MQKQNNDMSSSRPQTLFSIRIDILISLLLVVATLAVYWQVRDFDFVKFDDNLYVGHNSNVQNGLTWENVKYAFTGATRISNYWAPFVWLSHMADFHFAGLNPGRFHMTNLLFHVMSTFLVFIVFKKLTRQIIISGFVAALFGLHPMHVESVAWIAERKDMLCAFFWMLTMLFYARYAEQPSIYRYILVFIFFSLGLMSKPMVVTLPFALILLDYWPLGRIRLGQTLGFKGIAVKTTVIRAIGEKIPMVAMALVISIVTWVFQQQAGALETLKNYPLPTRAANMLVSYVCYLGKAVWPHNLAALYPFPNTIPAWQWAGALFLLAIISFFAIWSARNRPWFIVGWLWFLGVMFPVCGIITIGEYAMADRYAYITFIGLYIIVAWGGYELAMALKLKKSILALAAAGVLSAFALTTYVQAGHWKNSVSLFGHTTQVTSQNPRAYRGLGLALFEQLRLDEAEASFRKALESDPNYAQVHCDLGLLMFLKKDFKQAGIHFLWAFTVYPDCAEAANGLGMVYEITGKSEQAKKYFSRALQINPDFKAAEKNLERISKKPALLNK